MSKIIWGGIGTVVVLAATGVGAKIYADKSLVAYYQQSPKLQQTYQLSYSNYDMGAVSGSADVKMVVQRDPCRPDQQLVFVGQDEIKRTWKGYEIHSSLSLQNPQQHKDIPLTQPLTAITIIPWAGVIKTTVAVPKFSMQVETQKFDISPLQVELLTERAAQQAWVKTLEIRAPQITMNDEKGRVQLNNSVFKMNQNLNGKGLEAGQSSWASEQIHASLIGTDSASVTFNQFEVKADTVLHERTVDILSYLKVGQFSTGSTRYQNNEYYFDFKDLNRSHLEQYFWLFDQRHQSCAASKNVDDDLKKALLNVFNAGFLLESKNNKMTTSSGDLTANFNVKIMPNYVNSAASFKTMLPSLVDAALDVSVDKSFVMNLMSLKGQSAANINSAQVDKMLAELEQKGQIQRNGNQIKMAMTYKFGQPSFGTFH